MGVWAKIKLLTIGAGLMVLGTLFRLIGMIALKLLMGSEIMRNQMDGA